jgi:hypothetical protein
LRGIHRGIVGANGDATGEVAWRLGVGTVSGGRAFLELRNDVYAGGPPNRAAGLTIELRLGRVT